MGLPVMLVHYLVMGMISATVVAGLKTTGVILVVAMVITPASAAYQLCNRFSTMLFLSAAFGALSALGGMIVAYMINAPSGPSMVLVATLIFALAMLFSPRHGVLFDRLRRWRLRRHVETEDVLKALYHQADGAGAWCDLDAAVNTTKMRPAHVLRVARQMVREGLVLLQEKRLQLTDSGRARATEMVRAHRLWESYLSERANLAPDEVHDEAERLEHAHELADEVDQTLGHPRQDPHGEPIPSPEDG